SPPSIHTDLERAGGLTFGWHGRRWRIRRGLFPRDAVRGNGSCQVRCPHGPALHVDQALPDEVFDIGPHSAFVAAIGELCQVLLSNGAKLTSFDHRRDFRGPLTIGPAPDFVNLAQPSRASRVGTGMGACPLGTLFPHLVRRRVIAVWLLGVVFALLE